MRSSTPRVLAITENLPLARDHRLRKQVESMTAAGWQVTVICRSHPDNRRYAAGADVLGFPSPPERQGIVGHALEYLWAGAFILARVIGCLLTRRIDLIQVASTPDILVPVLRPLRLFGIALVFDWRDLSPETFQRQGGRESSLMCKTLYALERFSLRGSDRVITVNQSLADLAAERGGRSPGEVSIVGNGPRLGASSTTSRCLSPNAGPLTITWVGLMGPQDRVDLLLDVAERLVADAPKDGFELVLAGDGDVFGDLSRAVKERGLAPWVTLPGWLGPAEVVELLARTDIGVESNLDDFVTPVKVMEYMAAGLPTVAFDLTETRKLAGGSARYAPPVDVDAFAAHVLGLMSSPRMRRQLGDVGLERIRDRFSWERTTDTYLSGLTAALSDAPASHEGVVSSTS